MFSLLITDANLGGTITNSEMELVGGLLHLDAPAQTFDIRGSTVLSKTDNLNTLFWQRAGSATIDKVPVHLLRLFGIHQHFHHYIPCHDYLAGPSDPIADALSSNFSLTWGELMGTLEDDFPPGSGYQVWDPSAQMVKAVLKAIVRERQDPECLLEAPPAPQERSYEFIVAKVDWPCMPTSKPSRVKYTAYRKADDEFV